MGEFNKSRLVTYSNIENSIKTQYMASRSYNVPTIVKASSHKRLVTEKYSIDPIKKMGTIHTEEVKSCCDKILESYPNHQQSRFKIPEHFIIDICDGFNVTSKKIIRILNDGKIEGKHYKTSKNKKL